MEVGEYLLKAISPLCANPRLIEAVDYDTNELEHEDILLMVTSTQGEGEPPYGAEDLYDAIVGGKHKVAMNNVSYAVLGLGDSAYAENFNLMARQFDQRFEQLGAKRLLRHGECDFDYDVEAARWIAAAVPAVQQELGTRPAQVPSHRETPILADPIRENEEATATLIEREALTTSDSDKQVYRVRLELPESAHYLPGDLLAVSYVNSDRTVERFLNEVFPKESAPTRNALYTAVKYSRDITRTTPALISRYAACFGNAELLPLISDQIWMRRYAHSHAPSALFHDFPPQIQDITAESLLSVFTAPCRRMYSISNVLPLSQQPLSHTLLDLTVTKVEYTLDGVRHTGECSGMLTQAEIGTRMGFAVMANERFRLPADSGTPIVMVALGSAIAPYRAFLQERTQHHEAYGKNWLIIGNRNPKEDYLYQQDLQEYLHSGLLCDLDIAWSRSSGEHHHVQDVILKRGETLWQWIEKGAYIYLCGHGKAAVASIEQALRQVVAHYSGFKEAELSAYFERLKEGRHLQY